MAEITTSGPTVSAKKLYLGTRKSMSCWLERFFVGPGGVSDGAQGRIFKHGRQWIVEIPILDAMTQGRSRKEAFAMAADLVESLADRPKFKVAVHPGADDEFELSANDVRGLIALLLRRKREASGLTLAPSSPTTRCEVPQHLCSL